MVSIANRPVQRSVIAHTGVPGAAGFHRASSGKAAKCRRRIRLHATGF